MKLRFIKEATQNEDIKYRKDRYKSWSYEIGGGLDDPYNISEPYFAVSLSGLSSNLFELKELISLIEEQYKDYTFVHEGLHWSRVNKNKDTLFFWMDKKDKEDKEDLSLSDEEDALDYIQDSSKPLDRRKMLAMMYVLQVVEGEENITDIQLQNKIEKEGLPAMSDFEFDQYVKQITLMIN